MTESRLRTAWGKPGSTAGLLHDVGWCLLADAVFAALALWEPFSVEFAPAFPVSVVAVALGALLGVGLVYAPFVSERFRALQDSLPQRFVALFAFVMISQVGLWLIPTETILAMLGAFSAAIPTRAFVYWRAIS